MAMLSIKITKFDDDLVILIYNIAMDIISLIFKEVSGPDHLGQEIVNYDKLILS